MKALSGWIVSHGGIEVGPTFGDRKLRESLLMIEGVGPETADAIILDALGRRTFLVNAYFHRLFGRPGRHER